MLNTFSSLLLSKEISWAAVEQQMSQKKIRLRQRHAWMVKKTILHFDRMLLVTLLSNLWLSAHVEYRNRNQFLFDETNSLARCRLTVEWMDIFGVLKLARGATLRVKRRKKTTTKTREPVNDVEFRVDFGMEPRCCCFDQISFDSKLAYGLKNIRIKNEECIT